MAKNVAGNPWICDAAEVITARPTRVNYMTWTPEADGDDILVKDGGGNTIWTLKAIAADSNQGIEYEKRFETSVNGITITTIDSGTLYVHIY